MIIIRLQSGLGNQMFQYAFFRQMQYWHGSERVKLDISTYHRNIYNGIELDKVFNLDLQKDSVPEEVSLQYADVGREFRHRLLRRLRGKRHQSYKYWKDVEFEDYKRLGDVYLEGFWNEEMYFRDVQQDIRKAYTFKGDLNEDDLGMLEMISNTESVGVHVRRGDYKKFPKAFPMCQPSYYAEAREMIKAKRNSLIFFVFSDEIDWCRKNLSFPEKAFFVGNRKPDEAWKDMFLMSRCRHNIIANSAFSWWAAWLNNNQEKIVVYPESISLICQSMPKEWFRL